MYFDEKNSFFHGIMFHHFHDQNLHNKSQGSISKDDLYKIINFVGRENIINADIFSKNLKKKNLDQMKFVLLLMMELKANLMLRCLCLKTWVLKVFSLYIVQCLKINLIILRYLDILDKIFIKINDFYRDFFTT